MFKGKTLKKNSKYFITVFIAGLFLLTTLISVGFAALNQNLNIAGQLEYEKHEVWASNLSYDGTNSGVGCETAQCMIDCLANSNLCPLPTIYRWAGSYWHTNQDISSFTEGVDYVRNKSQLVNMNALASKYYLKYHISNNIVVDNYVCFVITQAMVQENPAAIAGEYCMQDGSGSYTLNKNILTEAFGSSSCTDHSSYYNCNISEFGAGANSDGQVYAGNGIGYCRSEGSSDCDIN